MKVSDTLRLALRALESSSPHADALNRWKHEEWQQLRGEAIAATSQQIERLTRQAVAVCIATAENAVSEGATPGATTPCTDAELLDWLEVHPNVELSALAITSSNRAEEPHSVVEITQASDGGALSRIELLATGATRRGALCAAVNRQKAIALASGGGSSGKGCAA